MNAKLNQLVAALSNLTESSGVIATVADKLLNSLLPQETASAATKCVTLYCGICIPIARVRLCTRRCCRRGFPCYNTTIRVSC